MKKYALAAALGLTAPMMATPADAQVATSVLLDTYGRGVHAYYRGHFPDAIRYFDEAIGAGLEDPRAYYFRGLSHIASGNTMVGQADWKEGADLEARGRIVGDIGQALIRFQGHQRAELEEIRRQARLQRLQAAAARSNQVAPAAPMIDADMPAAPPASNVPTPPPAPPAADAMDDPFADDAGEPQIEQRDALEGAADDPFADYAPAAPAQDAPAQPADPFSDDAPAADPFGGGGDDPFGGDAGNDPFGGGDDDPFAF